MQTVCASGMDRQMKGEYFKMKNHGLRRIFSLFLALFMVFTLLPTTALAEDTTGADETPPKTVVVNEGEKKTDPPAQEQPNNENPPAPEEPKTFTVTYTDGVGGAVFDNEVHSNLPSGTATPAFSGSLAREGYTFAGWNPAVAETVTADVTYAAQWEAGKTNPRRVTVPPIPDPGVAPAALNTGHKIDVRFTVLYVGDEFNIGYNYGSSEKTKFVCQYKTNHSDTAHNNHTIAISDIKAAAGRASVNSGYQIVGWSKESNANPTTWSLNKSGTTACNKGTTIYLVAKNPNPTTKYTYTLNYDANGGTGAPSADSWSTTDAAIRYHSFTVKNTIPTREGYVFKGWKAKDGSDTIYTGGTLCSVSQQGNDVVKNGNTWTRTLYAVWEKAVPSKPQWSDIRGEMQKVSVHVTCSNPDVNHTEKTYSYKESNDDTIGSVQDSAGSYTCTVTVHLGRYRLQYNQDFNREHEFASSLTADVVLQYNGTGWVIASALPLELKLTCGSAPTPNPPGSDVLNSLKVLVKCDSKTYHFEKPYKMDDGDYRLEKVDDNTYTVIVLADKYVEKYNAVYPGHTLFDNNTKTIKLVYRYGAWTVVGSNGVTFNVSCEQKYTVTYTDGVDGEVIFADQVSYKKSGEKTPAFRGTPTRTGYVFTGWNPAVAATVTGNATYTAVWEEDANGNGTPDKEEEKYTVSYTDGVENEEIFADQVYGNLLSGTATPAFNGTPTRAGYKFLGWEPTVAETVTENATYVAQWEKLYTVTYTDGVGGKAFKDDVHSDLEKDTPTPAFSGDTPTRKGFVFDGWNPEVAETVTEDVTYTAQWKPVQPDKKAIEGAIGRGVAVVCDNQNVNHGEKKYKPTLGEYTVSNVMGTAADGYTCTVTVRAAKFIEKYSSDMSDAVHTLIAGEPAEKTIELKWNGEKWVAETELPVTFHTLCPPEQPSKKDIEGAIGRGVKIVCDNQNVNHWGKDYKPTQGEYTVSDVTGTASEGYTCTITVKAAKIIEKYSSDMGKTHALIVGEQPEKTVELKWNGEKWVAKTELPITFHVECPPEKPTYDELKGLGINAKVDCTTTTAHNGKSYTLIEGTYEVSDPERKGTAYTCILTVNAKDYVAKYNAEENVGPHTLDDRDSKTIELTWNGEKWTAAETSVTFNVKCELLTVTYTDGVKGEEVFEDVVYKDIPYGTSTPAFGTKDPTREGYKFVGWEPEVAETVTKNVTYTAKWEKLYTVTYTDGVKGKAFKDQVYKDLESGADTPKFDGKPTRKGYTFTGWSPKVTDTVTKDVTYVAQWKSVKNGKDNIPKTGDSEIVMVLGSVLLFSFCGAAAVSVYDRKRKHF